MYPSSNRERMSYNVFTSNGPNKVIISSSVPHSSSSSSSNNISNTGNSNNLKLSAMFRKNWISTGAFDCSSVAKQDLLDFFLLLLLLLPNNKKYLSIFGEDPHQYFFASPRDLQKFSKLPKSGFLLSRTDYILDQFWR